MAGYSKLQSPNEKDEEWLSDTTEDGGRKRLLGNDDDDVEVCTCSNRSWLRRNRQTLILHVAFFLANFMVLAANASGIAMFGRSGDAQNHTPLRDVITYEQRPFNLTPVYLDKDTVNPIKSNDYNGPPRPELDEAWSSLMQYQNVRLSKSQLGQFAKDDAIVELADGTGSWTTVSVFHGLHCVERLHHFLYMETYYPNITTDEHFTLKRHTEHCIDWLRHYVQCNADTTLIPIQWSKDSKIPVATDKGNHKCVVWEPIFDWMASHSFNSTKPGLIVHPIFGDTYEDRQHSHGLGIVELGQGKLLHGHGQHEHDGH